MNLEAVMESLLYIAGEEGLKIAELSHLLEITSKETKKVAEALEQRLNNDELTGLMIYKAGEKLYLTTKKELEPWIRKYAQAPFMSPLSKAALEVLAIIAYRQPVTRMTIDKIRGVQSGGSIQKLLLRDLVEEKGRVEGPGRPLLYGTTDYFLNYFGMNGIEELPELPDQKDRVQEEMDLFFGSYDEERLSKE